MEVKRELMPKSLLAADGPFEEALLDLPGQIRPKRQGGISDDVPETCGVLAHGDLLQRLSGLAPALASRDLAKSCEKILATQGRWGNASKVISIG